MLAIIITGCEAGRDRDRNRRVFAFPPPLNHGYHAGHEYDPHQGLECYNPIPEFQAHLATIRHRLPVDLPALQESVSLHDANVREMNFNTDARRLDLRLDGSDGNGGARHFTLHYEGVMSFRSTADPDMGRPGPRGYGDLGYDEADVTDDGVFEHRLLFSNGIEFQIVFSGFTLLWRNASWGRSHAHVAESGDLLL